MSFAISIAELRRHAVCNLPRRIRALEDHLNRRVPEDEPVPLRTWAEITPSTADLVWALRVRPEGAAIAQKIALRAARRALPLTGVAQQTCEAALAGEASEPALYSVVVAARAAHATHPAHTNAVYAVVDAATSVRHSAHATYAYVYAADAADAAARAAADSDAERAHQRADLLELLRGG